MWLISRDDDVIGQILMVLKVKEEQRREKKNVQ